VIQTQLELIRFHLSDSVFVSLIHVEDAYQTCAFLISKEVTSFQMSLKLFF